MLINKGGIIIGVDVDLEDIWAFVIKKAEAEHPEIVDWLECVFKEVNQKALDERDEREEYFRRCFPR